MFIDLRSERAFGELGNWSLVIGRWSLVRAERGLVREGRRARSSMVIADLYGCTVSQRVAIFNSFFGQREAATPHRERREREQKHNSRPHKTATNSARTLNSSSSAPSKTIGEYPSAVESGLRVIR